MKSERSVLRFFMAALLALSACACSTEGDIQRILRKNAEAPVYLDCRPVSSRELDFEFSQPVRVLSLNFDPPLETESIEEGRKVKVGFSRPLEAGQRITADILVEDGEKNSLNVIVPFRARNDRLPELAFNEIRTEYSKSKDYKIEFVELLALGPGNLGALRFFAAGHSLEEPVYEFPPAEVKAGEYIVLHLRTREENCVDETGENLALSGGADARDGARDFWLPGNKKWLHKTDALWLLDQDGAVKDAVLLCEKPGAAWPKAEHAAAAEFLGRSGAWLPPAIGADSAAGAPTEGGFIPGPDAAVNTEKSAATRTVCRDETLPPERRAKNWYIAATSSATPGRPNSPKRHE